MDPRIMKIISNINHIVLANRLGKAHRQLESQDPEERKKGEGYIRGQRIALATLAVILLAVVVIAFWPIVLIGGAYHIGPCKHVKKEGLGLSAIGH